MHLQAAFLFAKEIGKFFSLTALDLLNWITQWWHDIKIQKFQGWISKRFYSYVYPLKNYQISWNCSFKGRGKRLKIYIGSSVPYSRSVNFYFELKPIASQRNPGQQRNSSSKRKLWLLSCRQHSLKAQCAVIDEGWLRCYLHTVLYSIALGLTAPSSTTLKLAALSRSQCELTNSKKKKINNWTGDQDSFNDESGSSKNKCRIFHGFCRFTMCTCTYTFRPP
jgi:hypothetical protein